MNTILSVDQAINTSKQLKKLGKKIVLAGGCFDILHIGHLEFLEASKKYGDALVILLESDESIQRLKGNNRPINSQTIRARILASLKWVDFVVLLPSLYTNLQYDDIIEQLKPDIITITKGDPYQEHKERQAQQTGAQVIEVLARLQDQSTSRIAQLLEQEH